MSIAEARPAETDKMNISKKFLKVLKLSFETKYLSEDVNLSKKENKVKAVEERLDVLYNNIMDISMDPKLDDIIALAIAYHNIGQIYVNSIKFEELNFAVVCLSKCLELLRGKQLNPKAILTSISALNELNLVCDKVEKKKYTFKFLNTAMELYLKYTVRDDYPDPVHIATIIDIKEEESNPRIILDTFHHTTLQDLGIQYLIKPKDKHGFVLYMHNLLKGRLSQMISEGRQFQVKCLDLALTLFDLSKYFLANGRFAEARNHIATADYVVYRFFEDTFKTTKKKGSKSRFNNLYDESCDYVRAISARYWGTYGVSLLRFWVNTFLQNKAENSYELDISKLEIKSEEESTKLLIFSDLEEELKQIANQITNTRILNLTDAKSIFVQTLRQLDIAQEYFAVDTNIESYVKITLEISETYKYLAGFEQHRDKQIKLHKRRVECLENLCQKFNTTINGDAELQLYKRIWYELVTSCSTVMDLMLEEMYYEPFKDMSVEADRFTKMISTTINLYLNV